MRKFVLALLLCLPAIANAAPWTLNTKESSIKVQVGYLGGKGVAVNFRQFNGPVEFDEKRPQNAKATIKVDSAKLETGLGFINNLVRSADYLDTARHPEITFQLDRLTQTSKSTADITGRITLRGITKPVKFTAVVFRYGPSKLNPDVFEAGFNLTGSIDRRDFGSVANVPQVAPVLPVSIRLVMTSKPT